MTDEQKGEIIIYQTEEGQTKIDVRFENENLWLSQQQMAELYQSSRTNIVEHIKHIYDEGELEETATCRKFRQVESWFSSPSEYMLPICSTTFVLDV